MARKYRTLSLNDLNNLCAPYDEIAWFKEVFGKKATLHEVVRELHKRHLGWFEAWLLSRNLQLTKALVEAGANVTVNNSQALKIVSGYGEWKIVKYLVTQGAGVGVGHNNALVNATYGDYYGLVKFLIRHGANVRNSGAIQEAEHNSHPRIKHYLRRVMRLREYYRRNKRDQQAALEDLERS